MLETDTNQCSFTAEDLHNRRSIVLAAECRVNTRQWIKDEVIPYIRSHGGLVTLKQLCDYLGRPTASVANLLTTMPRTIYRYRDHLNRKYVGMFDRQLTNDERIMMQRTKEAEA